MVKKKIGKCIQERREALGLNQEQLGEAVDLSTQSISFIETGRNAPSMDSFIRIANALHTTADSLLEDVLECSYQVKASKLEDIVAGLPMKKQEQILNVVAAVLELEE